MTSSNPAWTPTADHLEQSRVVSLMRRLKVDTIDDLRDRAVADPCVFWDTVVEDLDIAFATPYRQVRDLTDGKAHAQWFIGGRINLAEGCVDRWARDPGARDRTAIVAESEDGSCTTLTFAELGARVDALASALVAAGIGEGDAVGLFLPMVVEAATAFYAIAKIGALCVPIFSGFAAPAVAARLRDSGARILLTSTGTLRRGRVVDMWSVSADAVAESPQVQTVVVLGGANARWEERPTGRPGLLLVDWADFVSPHEGARPLPADTSAEAPFMIAYTSGTTGQPKGAVHVHGGFLVKVASEAAYQTDVGPGDVLFWLTDMGWIMGAWMLVGAHGNGAAAVLFDGAPDYPDAGRLWSLVGRHNVTTLGLSPTLARALRKDDAAAPDRYDLSSLRILGSAGEPWDDESYRWYLGTTGSRCPVINFSGGTEVGACFLSNYPVEAVSAGSLGGPSLGMAVDVFDPQGQSLRGEVGELVCTDAWPSMTRGIWGDADRYLATYWCTYPDVWHHGDWALVSETGQWYLLGRSDDTINVAGKRVAPAEIEAVLVNHPQVRDVAVIGVPHPGKGESIWCFVVTASPGPDLAVTLGDRVVDAMGKPFRPARVIIVPDLPKTASGKTVRRTIRAVVTGERAGDTSTLSNPDSLSTLAAAVRDSATDRSTEMSIPQPGGHQHGS